MRSPRRRCTRVAGLVLTAVGVLAILALPGVAAAKDRNHDRIPDRWEKRHHLSTKVNQDNRDQDGDHLRNMGEFQAGDNPRNDDSDGDGVMDGEENAGTITAFDATTGKLTINLFNGETVSGLVTESTRIECGHECHQGDDSADSRPGEDGDHSGPNSGPPGQGEDGSDDPPGHNGMPPGAGCTTAALVVGATVEEAELEIHSGAATFEEVELAK
ncbi:MAG TPA: hypothetical protein VII45_04785 [Solirubrobacterales bacterium]